jgi:hypothetical protein
VLVLLVLLAVSGCASRSTSSTDAASRTPTAGQDASGESPQALTGTVAALCRVQQDAARSVPAARATFYDRAHDGLHALARVVETKDRVVAARLLEAKNAVEQDLGQPRSSPRLHADLPRLVATAGDALEVLSLTPPRCAR